MTHRSGGCDLKKLTIALALTVLLVFAALKTAGDNTSFAATSCTATGVESITTDKNDYAPEETVTIAGVGFAGDCDVTVRVTRPDGSIVTGDGTFGPWPTAMTPPPHSLTAPSLPLCPERHPRALHHRDH